jgi:hypothetical protein
MLTTADGVIVLPIALSAREQIWQDRVLREVVEGTSCTTVQVHQVREI